MTPPATGQTTPASPQTGIVTGVVTEAISGAVVSHILVDIDDGRWSTNTDAAGFFRIADVSVGNHLIRFRGIGFSLATEQITVAPNGTAVV